MNKDSRNDIYVYTNYILLKRGNRSRLQEYGRYSRKMSKVTKKGVVLKPRKSIATERPVLYEKAKIHQRWTNIDMMETVIEIDEDLYQSSDMDDKGTKDSERSGEGRKNQDRRKSNLYDAISDLDAALRRMRVTS